MDNNESHDLYNLVQSDDNIELVRKLLAGDLDLNLEHSQGETLLHIAAMSAEDNVEVVRELIKAGFDVNKSSNQYYKPLHCAVINRNRRVVEELLKCKIDINGKDYSGKTALHFAAYTIPPQNVHFPEMPVNTLLPDAWIVRKLLDHKDTNVDDRDFYLHTPLMLAVADKHAEIVKLLLNRGSNVFVANKVRQTPLHIALAQVDPCPYILVLLLLKRSNVYKMDQTRETPLNVIREHTSFNIACICLKVIAFHYDISEPLLRSLFQNCMLSQTLDRYYEEINRMKCDFISKELTVFDFLGKRALQSGFVNPVLEIYKPIIERLITGNYPEYFCYIFHRISKSSLSEVLKYEVNKRYCKKNSMDKQNCGDENCEKNHRTPRSEVFRFGLLSDYLENFDIFCLIVTFSRVKIEESFLNVRHHECYLTDSWEEYPNDYFNLS